MSGSYVATEVHYHVRSISLPSRLHLSCNDIEIELKKLKTFEASHASIDTSSFLQASAISADLTKLVHLHNCVQELIGLPLTQKALLHQCHQEEKHLEKALDMSLGLLDVCGSARELLLLMKEQVQDLQSAMRRKGLDSSIKSQICAHIYFRKRARKEISKILKALKTMESGFKSQPLLDVDHHVSKVTKVLRELSVVTILFLRKLLLFMCPQVLKKNASGWSLFRLVQSTRFDREKRVINEMGGIDISLCSLHRSITKNDAKDIDLQIVKRRLEELNGGIRELEAGLGCLFRCLIRQRVSLLNLLTS